MIDNEIEITKEILTIDMGEPSNINIDEIIKLKKERSVKINIEVSTSFQLKQFNALDIFSIENIHVSVLYTKQTFLTENITEIMNRSLIKLVDIEGMRIRLNFFTTSEVNTSIIENNTKILEQVRYIPSNIKMQSKNYEILYQANQILKEYKKVDDNKKELINKINVLHSYSNKL